MRHDDLRVFHLADELVLAVYRMTEHFPSHEYYGIRSQMRRAAVSIVSNIVEGTARGSQRDFANFLRFAYASTKELEYQLSLSERLGYLPDKSYVPLTKKCQTVGGAIYALRRTVKSSFE